jgi:hypothetical protein
MPYSIFKHYPAVLKSLTDYYKVAIVIINTIKVLIMPYSFYDTYSLLYKIAPGY